MTQDARFQDGREAPLNLGALEPEDVKVISALVQDAVFPISEMAWHADQRRFGILLNRFRWEDDGQGRHGPERVQSVFSVQHVTGVSSQGIDRRDQDMVLSVLAVDWEPGEDADGFVLLTLAGDGAIRLRVEALELGLRDVTRPYHAPSGHTPDHES